MLPSLVSPVQAGRSATLLFSQRLDEDSKDAIDTQTVEQDVFLLIGRSDPSLVFCARLFENGTSNDSRMLTKMHIGQSEGSSVICNERKL